MNYWYFGIVIFFAIAKWARLAGSYNPAKVYVVYIWRVGMFGLLPGYDLIIFVW